MQQKAPWLGVVWGGDTGNRKWGMFTCWTEVFKTQKLVVRVGLYKMTEIQILAGSSDKPSISSEGFSHSIFTAPVGSYLQKCVPKPLKDTSLWPWGWGERVLYTKRTWLFEHSSALVGLMPPMLSRSGLSRQTRVGWTLALEGCGMAYSEILPARLHIEPPFLHLNTGRLSRRSALTFPCELHRPGNQTLILPFAPTSSLWFYYIFLQLNTASWLSLNLHH